MPKSFHDFKDKIRREIWKFPGEPKNLRQAHDSHFQEAMLDLAQWVPCLKGHHVSVFPACSTYVRCGITSLPAIRGDINYVYTIANDDWCDPVWINQTSHDEILRWSNRLTLDWTQPPNTGFAALQQGFKFAEAATDSPLGRSRHGWYSIYRDQMHIAPWLQSYEKLVIEWDGERYEWLDTDIIDETLWNHSIQAAIKQYVRYAHERDFGDNIQQQNNAKHEYDNRLADAMHWCRRRTEEMVGNPGYRTDPIAVRPPTAEEQENGEAAVEVPQTGYVIGNIGDFGDPDNAPWPQAVADIVIGWDPDFIVTNGDNLYSPAGNYEDAVGAFYGDYITDDLQTNRFWPALGNHDHSDPANGLQDYLDYFTLPNNERYYDFVKGPIHFFIYHTALPTLGGTSPEPDGIDVNSIQAEWLRVKMAASKVKWKVVVLQDPPYTNATNDFPGHAVVRLPFKAWGADLVISGDTHAYQRFTVDGLTYVVNGAGGRDISGSGTASPNENDDYLDFQLFGTYGALKLTVECASIIGEFIDTEGTVQDTFTLEK